MHRYYIHIDNGLGFIRDETGQDFADFEEARRYAIRSGAEIMGHELSHEVQTVTLTLTIEDAAHALLATLPMQASLQCRTSQDGGAPDEISPNDLSPNTYRNCPSIPDRS